MAERQNLPASSIAGMDSGHDPPVHVARRVDKACLGGHYGAAETNCLAPRNPVPYQGIWVFYLARRGILLTSTLAGHLGLLGE